MLDELVQKLNPQDPRQAAIKDACKALKYPKKMKDLPFAKTVLESSLPEQREWLLSLMVGLKKMDLDALDARKDYWHQRWELREFCFDLLKRKLPFTAEDLLLMVEWWSEDIIFYRGRGAASLVKACETYFKAHAAPHPPQLLAALQGLAKRLNDKDDSDAQRYGSKLLALLHAAAARSMVRARFHRLFGKMKMPGLILPGRKSPPCRPKPPTTGTPC